MEVGYYLSESEVNELLANFKEKQKFHNLIKEMKKHEDFDFDPKTVEVIQGLKFDTVKEKEVISAKVLALKINEKISIRYITRQLNGDLDTKNDFFVGDITSDKTKNDNTIKHLVFRARHDDEVSTLEKEYAEEAIALSKELDEEFDQEFNFDENYYPGQLLDQVDSEAVIQGCIAGGYLYCGAACGGYPACSGSRSGINGLDNCCKKHDCCYHTKNTSGPNCYCDQNLCDCAQAAPWKKATPLVEAAFCFVC